MTAVGVNEVRRVLDRPVDLGDRPGRGQLQLGLGLGRGRRGAGQGCPQGRRPVADVGLVGVWVVASPGGWNIGLRPLGPFSRTLLRSGQSSPKSGFLPDSPCSSVMCVTLEL